MSTDDQLQRRFDRLGQILGLPLLAVSTLLAWVSEASGFGGWPRFEHGLAVVAAAAVWTLSMSMRPPERSAPIGITTFLVHSGLAAGLLGGQPWVGAFALSRGRG